MKKVTIILLLLFFSNLFAQKFSVDSDLTKSFMEDPEKTSSLDVLLNSAITSDRLYEFTLTFQEDTQIFKMKQLTYAEFEAKLKFNLSQLIARTNDNTASDPPKQLAVKNSSKLTTPKNSIILLFTQIVSYYNTEEERP